MQHSPEEAHEIKTIISNKEHSFWLELRNRLEITKRNRNIDLSIHF
jgi:hypothetical protein